MSIVNVKKIFYNYLGSNGKDPVFYKTYFDETSKRLDPFPDRGPLFDNKNTLFFENQSSSTQKYYKYIKFCETKNAEIVGEINNTTKLFEIYEEHENEFANLRFENDFFRALADVVYIKFNLIFWGNFPETKGFYQNNNRAIKPKILENIKYLIPQFDQNKKLTFDEINSAFANYMSGEPQTFLQPPPPPPFHTNGPLPFYTNGPKLKTAFVPPQHPPPPQPQKPPQPPQAYVPPHRRKNKVLTN